MLATILWLVVLIFIVLPICWAIASEDIHRMNKKVEDHYKEMEEKRKNEYAAMYTTVEDDIDDDEDDDN